MARGGLRVLCLEKNHFIGGMASTTELIRGYRFELAGSIQFPVPNEIYEDLDLASCPIYEPEVQSASIGDRGQPPLYLYSDPERLLNHLGETLGIEAVLGMAEVAAWAEAPARAIGRFDVRRPPRSLDEMWDSPTNEAERQAIRTAMFGSVMDVVDRYLPDKAKHAPVRAMLSFLAVNSTFRGPCFTGQRTLPRLRLGVAGQRDDVEGARWARHHRRPPVPPVRAARRRAAPPRQGGAHRGRWRSRQGGRPRRRRGGDRADRRLQPRPHRDVHPTDGCRRPPRGLCPAGRRHRPQSGLLPGPLRTAGAARVPRALRGSQRLDLRSQRHLLRHGGADAAGLRRLRPRPGTGGPELQPADPLAR